MGPANQMAGRVLIVVSAASCQAWNRRITTSPGLGPPGICVSRPLVPDTTAVASLSGGEGD